MKKFFVKLFIIIILIIILAIILISILNKNVIPIYMNYSESEMERVVTVVVNKVVNETNLNEELFIVKNDINGTTIVDYDPVVINRIMCNISSYN